VRSLNQNWDHDERDAARRLVRVETVEVLVVDDDEAFRSVICTLLENHPGVVVVGQAKDGQEAVRLVAELHPSVVLMDLDMPVMDGFAATALLRELAPKVPVIVLSGNDHEKDVARARTLGAVRYLRKADIGHVLGLVLAVGRAAAEAS